MGLIIHLVVISAIVLAARSASARQTRQSCDSFCQQNGQFVCCNQVQPVPSTAGSSDCLFPFIYKGVTYTGCTTKDDPDGKPWCSTQTDNRNNHINGKWKHCKEPAAPFTSAVCQFPFIHKGVTYTGCTTKDDPDGRPWCSTQTDNRNNHINGKWKHCQARDTSIAPPPTSSTSGLLPSTCGAVSDGDRIVGGTELRLKSFIWMALLGFNSRNNPDWLCGASLISQRYVVTAAHCVTGPGGPPVVVRIGEHDTSKASDCQQVDNIQVCAPPVQDFAPEKIVNHHSWTLRSRFSDDISLIRLDRTVQFNSFVQPICLPPQGLDVRAFLQARHIVREAETAGWGSTENGQLSAVKRVVKVPFREKGECTDGKGVRIRTESEGQLCFGAVDGKDSCGGDSGGPLVGNDLNAGNSYVLLGVVSYGPTDCGHNSPGVYTDVGHYRNWIDNNLRP